MADTKIIKEIDTSGNSTIFMSFISSFFDWIYTRFDNPEVESIDEDELSKGWAWLLSKTEENILKKEKENREKIKEELTSLRRITTNVRMRPKVIQEAQQIFTNMDKERSKLLIEQRLDGNNRLRLIRDYVKKVERIWLSFILQLIKQHYAIQQITLVCMMNGNPSDNLTSMKPSNVRKDKNIRADLMMINDKANEYIGMVRKSWLEEKYEKNFCGEVISLIHQATYATERSGLTFKTLGDGMWTSYLSLSKLLTEVLKRSLYTIEGDKLLTLIIDSHQPFIELWYQVSVKMGTINQRTGLLPLHWNLQKLEHENSLKEIKNRGVDAKFNDGPNDPLWYSHYAQHHQGPPSTEIKSLWENSNEFKRRSEFLSNNLPFLPRKSSTQ